MIDKGVCNKGFIWNDSNCECECDKSCDIVGYLDHSNCKCTKKLVDQLIEECTENNDEVEITSQNEHKCSSCITLCYFQYSLQSVSELLPFCLFILEQEFIETYINGTSQRINIKNQTFYFFWRHGWYKKFPLKLIINR